ncbi:MAG: hypothetical protein JO332_02445 [Planctomycetaceae bacterium]|nr:hypothetical protein [Planctomycetaceae bacterium]
MKNKSIGSLILLALLAPSCGGGGGAKSKRSITPPRWEETFRKPTSVDLRAVRFGNANQGIVAGKFGTFVRTDNGGNTWYQLEHTPATLTGDILAMRAGSTTTVAVGGAPAGGPYTSSVSWISGDATTFVAGDDLVTHPGVPWVDVALTVPASNQAAAGTLYLRSDGHLDVFQGTLLATQDSTTNETVGGVTPPPTPWTTANGVAALGSSAYWLVCGDNAGVGQIRRTKNSGGFFDTLKVPAACKPLRRMSMISTIVGFACGDNGTLLRIAPDTAPTPVPLGDNWADVLNKPGAVTQNLNALQFLDQDTGWAVGDSGRIVRIRNASTATPIWDQQAVGLTPENLYDVNFVDLNFGYAVGNNGVVLKTVDGGVNWTVKSGPPAAAAPIFKAVEFTSNAAVGLAVGNAVGTTPTLVRSLDGGRSWTAFSTGIPASSNLVAAAIPRNGTGTVAFVVRDNGDVFYTTDLQGAGPWTGPTSLGFVVRSILFAKDDAAGIATGAAGNIRILTFANPGGITVTSPVPAPPAQAGTNYAAAADPTGNTLYIAGDNSYLIQSSNGGTTWTAVSPAPPAALSFRTLQAPSGPTYQLFAGASDQFVYRLSTAAPAWTQTAGAGFSVPVSMSFVDDTTGFAVTQGATGGFFYTTNSGTLWKSSVMHVDTTAHVLNGLWMHGGGQTGFIVGDNGMILRTGTAGQ